jgi:hypothetical protein
MKKLSKVREGKRRRGVILKQVCGFCGKRMRSVSQRNDHTDVCKEKI